MIDALIEELSLTLEQQAKLEAWAKTNIRNKHFSVHLTAEDVEEYGYGDLGALIDSYRQKAALEARLLLVGSHTETVREDLKTDLTITFSLQAVK